ncbi:aconitase family protein [Nannocystis sp. ILAH1]|uniref:aconitase family protein n=1 Tax=unclassified Nannocystis TaxID=2627009 RepID=UPI00226F49A1|nr:MULTISPECIES: aconitase family protein [unclassified Nannocystis]MCY0993128.1 aconitase family protein [Nannocystis sp. ILAH1]MCY1063439.1 aconitase family protein [Nannocystis sp. RBIL2]
MKLRGRILWLTDDPHGIAKQLTGTDLDARADAAPPLHYGVNTDLMISGAACTLGYTGDILGPYFLENFKEQVQKDSIKDGGFQVVVGGDAYGSGSSREVAVVAHQGAGIELVVARSFQRIFQENMVYSGLPFTTDFGVIGRLQAGEDVDLGGLAAELPPFFRAVVQNRGLLRYGSRLLAGEIEPEYRTDAPARPLNCVEKIIAARTWAGGERFGIAAVGPGDQVLCEVGFRGVHEYTGGMVMALYEQEWGNTPVKNPELAAAFEDHFVLIDQPTVPLRVKKQRLDSARQLRDEMVSASLKNGIRIHGPGQKYDAGVCHRIVVEQYGNPGTIIILTDSHTPTAGVLNAFAFGVGSTAMAFALRTGLVPVTVPKTVRIWVTGDARGVVSPKDLILHIIGDPYFREEQWRTSATDTCVIQIGGPGLDQWNVDELSVLTNMTVEGGLMTGVVEPCAPVREFLRTRRPGVDTDALFVEPDEGAEYVRTIAIDLTDVPLTVATPGDSRNRAALADVGDVPIHNVVIASCTGGSLADLRAAADVLRGRKLAPKVRVTVTPSSAEVSASAEREGLLGLFRELGAVVTAPGCGSCIGNGPGIPLEGETTASTTNRNFDRRMGAPGPVYLVSPAVAAASAVTGHLTDPRDLSGAQA